MTLTILSQNLIEEEQFNSAAEYLFQVETSGTGTSIEQGISEREIMPGEVYALLKNAVSANQPLSLSVLEAKKLLELLDDLIRDDIEAYLTAMEETEADEVDEHGFIEVTSTQFWEENSPGDRIYDDL